MAKWAVTLLVGAAVGALAFLVEHSVTVTTRARLAIIQRVLDANADDPPRGFLAASAVAVASAVLLAVPAALLVLRVSPAAAGAGVALVMASLDGVHVPRLFSLSTALVKVFGTILSVSSGLPVGPEGPLVHIGAGVASLFTRQQRFVVGDRVVFPRTAANASTPFVTTRTRAISSPRGRRGPRLRVAPPSAACSSRSRRRAALVPRHDVAKPPVFHPGGVRALARARARARERRARG